MEPSTIVNKRDILEDFHTPPGGDPSLQPKHFGGHHMRPPLRNVAMQCTEPHDMFDSSAAISSLKYIFTRLLNVLVLFLALLRRACTWPDLTMPVSRNSWNKSGNESSQASQMMTRISGRGSADQGTMNISPEEDQSENEASHAPSHFDDFALRERDDGRCKANAERFLLFEEQRLPSHIGDEPGRTDVNFDSWSKLVQMSRT
jgi:hypothetical protein